MAKAKKVSKIKVKKKRWFPIFAPKFLGQKEIGESYLNQAEEAIGRVMKVNLRDLTGSMGDQNIYASLKINEVTGSSLQTEIVGYALMSFYLKKLARRNTGKVGDSFVLKTKDNKLMRLKPLVLTVFAVNNSVKTTIRKELQKYLKEEASRSTFEGLVNDLLRRRLQVDFKKKLNKICPVKEVILKEVKLEKKKIGAKVKKEEESPEEKPAEEPEEDQKEK
jgi:ribosomal protein S3AE